MAVVTQGVRPVEFILWEQGGTMSRANGTLLSGQNLVAGTVVMKDGAGKLTAYLAGSVTDGGAAEAEGILLYSVNASAGDVKCSYLARDAEVNLKMLTYPAGTDEEANTIASLRNINIIARDDGWSPEDVNV